MTNRITALGLYDYCITLEQEICQVWMHESRQVSKRKINWMSILFFVNRYSIIATAITMLVKDLHILSPTSRVRRVDFSPAHLIFVDVEFACIVVARKEYV